MVALNFSNDDPTLKAMHQAIEARGTDADREPEGPRSYLGASILGHECERVPWYQYHMGEQAAPMEAKGIYAVCDGHRTEDVIAARLRLVPGVEIWTHDEAGEQFGFTDFDGQFSGHIDGVIKGLLQAPAKPHIWENKACGEKKYNKFVKAKDDFGEKAALKNWDISYFVQAQIYMGESPRFLGMQIDRHYLTVSLAGGRDIVSARTEFDPKLYQLYKAKAKRIIDAKRPPERISERKEFYLCKWCKFYKPCWEGEKA